jgi:hypothetical protein
MVILGPLAPADPDPWLIKHADVVAWLPPSIRADFDGSRAASPPVRRVVLDEVPQAEVCRFGEEKPVRIISYQTEEIAATLSVPSVILIGDPPHHRCSSTGFERVEEWESWIDHEKIGRFG